MVVSQGPGTLDLFDPTTHAARGSVGVGQAPHWIGLAGAGHAAYVTNEASNEVSVVDLDAGSVTATIPVGQGPRKIVVQPGAGPAAAIAR
jgi:YVTN family beta-propeller protein